MDLAGGTLVISSCWWITGGWNEENEFWSINLFIHHYSPLSCSVCQCVHPSLSVSFLNLWLHRSCPTLPEGTLRHHRLSEFSFHCLSGSWEWDKAAPWRHWRTPHPSGRCVCVWVVGRGQRGLIRIFLSQSDDPFCQVTILESSWVWGIFQPQQGVETLKGDVERESIELLGSGRAGLVCLMAWGVWRAIKRAGGSRLSPLSVPALYHRRVTTTLATPSQCLLIYKGQTRDNNNNRFVEMKNHCHYKKKKKKKHTLCWSNFRPHLVLLTVKTNEFRCLLSKIFCSTSW